MTSEYLFSYGTLQLDAVQMATFGRLLTGTPDTLPGFIPVSVEIDDPTTVRLSGKSQHAIAQFAGKPADTIAGTVYTVTSDEITRADQYEVDAYKRVSVVLESGLRSWVYVDARYGPPND